MFDGELPAYEFAAAGEPKFTRPSEVLQAIKRLKFDKAAIPNGIHKSVLRDMPKRAIS
jgi:hypothetical protein